MPRLLQSLVEPPRPCAYLPDRTAQLAIRVMTDVTAAELEAMLLRGWRRFGPVYFRSLCPACAECVSIRLPVERFAPDAAQRRAAKRLAKLRKEIGVPRVDPERLALFAKWHAAREDARGWEEAPQTAESYGFDFAYPHPAAREITYWDDAAEGGPRLVGVSLTDETPRALSAIYFFYDPAYARWSPGVMNVLFHVELARRKGMPHVYLGYRVKDCPSMRYKARYRPHELLVGAPGPDEEPLWAQADSDPAGYE